MNISIWKEIFSWIGGIAVFILAIWGAIKIILIEWLKIRFNSQANQKLEELKGQIGNYNASLNSITQAYLNNYQKVQDKRIEAAEALWQAVLKVKYGVPYDLSVAVRAYSFEALQKLAKLKTEGISERIKSSDMVTFQNLVHDTARDLEKFKPFISDRCFLYFESYASLVYAYFHLIFDGIRNGNLGLWSEDFNLKIYAKLLTSEEQLNILYQTGMKNFMLLQIVAEKNIVAELRSSIDGRNMSLDASDYIKGANEILTEKKTK